MREPDPCFAFYSLPIWVLCIAQREGYLYCTMKPLLIVLVLAVSCAAQTPKQPKRIADLQAENNQLADYASALRAERDALKQQVADLQRERDNAISLASDLADRIDKTEVYRPVKVGNKTYATEKDFIDAFNELALAPPVIIQQSPVVIREHVQSQPVVAPQNPWPVNCQSWTNGNATQTNCN